MEQTLGQTIGVMVDNFSVTNDAGDKIQLMVKYDVRNAPDNVIKAWICADRRIKVQGTLRKKTRSEIESLKGHTFTFDGSRQAIQIDGKTAVANELTRFETREQKLAYLKSLESLID